MTSIPKDIQLVLDDIADGSMPVFKACEKHGITKSHFWKAIQKFPEVEDHYIRAREYRAHWRYEDLDNTIEDLANGVIDPNTARVIIDTRKWQMGKEKAKVYGDKVPEQVATVTNNMIITSQVLDLLGQEQLEALRLKLGAPVIDHVPDAVTPES